jgi:septum formation protein
LSCLVLASTSAGRRHQLATLGLPFDAVAPDLDEQPWHDLGLAPHELVTRLALAKAEAVADRYPDAWVIGGDQIAEIDGDVLNKPGTAERAVRQLARLQGRTHRLCTGLAVVRRVAGVAIVDLQVTELTMRVLTEAQLHRYVELDDPVHCAGSYKFESLGAALFERVRGDDPTAIVGLPLLRLTALLSASGFEVLAPHGP